MNDDVYNDNSGSWNACITWNSCINCGGSYDVIVTGVCGSETSSVAMLTIEQPAMAPSALTGTAVSSNQIALTWTNDVALDGIKIERAADVSGSPGTWVQIGNVDASSMSYIDMGVATNTTYWYQVLSYNVCGDSTNSNQIAVDVAPPATPSNLVAVAVATNQVNLSWINNAEGEVGFYIERAPDAGGSPGTWTQIGSVLTNMTHLQ
jgi:chitodextrinase